MRGNERSLLRCAQSDCNIRVLFSMRASSRPRPADASLAPANFNLSWGCRMTRIAILDRADMNAEQARVYDLSLIHI